MDNNGPENVSRRSLLKKAGGLLIHASLPSSNIISTVQSVLAIDANMFMAKCKKQVADTIQACFSDTLLNSTDFLLLEYQEKKHLAHAQYTNYEYDFGESTSHDHLAVFANRIDDIVSDLHSIGALKIPESDSNLLDELYRTKNEVDIDGQFRSEYMKLIFESIPNISFDLESFRTFFLKNTLLEKIMLNAIEEIIPEHQNLEELYIESFIDDSGSNIFIKIFDGEKYIFETHFLVSEILTPDVLGVFEGEIGTLKNRLELMLHYSPDELMKYYDEGESSWDFYSAIKNSAGKIGEENLQYKMQGLFNLSKNQLEIGENIDLEDEEEIDESIESWDSDKGEVREEKIDNGEMILLEKK